MIYYREWIDIEFHGWQNKSFYFSVRKKDGSEAAIFHWKRQMLKKSQWGKILSCSYRLWLGKLCITSLLSIPYLYRYNI